MKIFAVSISAQSPFIGSANEQSGAIYMHYPGMLIAETMDHAADMAQQKSFELWPQSEGWSEHQAALTPITKLFYEAFTNAMNGGNLDMSEGESAVYHFPSIQGQSSATDSSLLETEDEGFLTTEEGAYLTQE